MRFTPGSFVAALAGLALVLSIPLALAADDHKPGDGHEHEAAGHKDHDGHETHKDHAGGADHSKSQVKAPSSLKEAWSIIGAKLDEGAKNSDGLHEVADHLEAAGHYLSDNASMVTGEAKTRLDSVMKQYDKSLHELHEAAEAKDATKSGMELKKITGLLPLIEAQFPAGTLK